MTHLAILNSALLLLLLLLILLALLLLIPIDLEGRGSRGVDRPETRMKIGWLFGLLQKDVSRSADEREPSENEEDKKEKKGKEKEAKEGPGSSRIALEVLRTEGFLRNLAHLLRGLVRALRVQFLWIDIKLGLSDPADTAEAVGLLWAILIPLEALTPLRARIVPYFSEETLEGSVEGKLRIWPYKTVPPMIRFLLSPPTWRAGLKAISMKRGKR